MKYCSDLPGKSCRALSFIPAVNWIALLYLGGKCSHELSVICGLAYGTITFATPSAGAVLWIVAMIQYAITWKVASQVPPPITKTKPSIENATVHPSGNAPPPRQTSNLAAPGIAAKTQATPPRSYTDVVVSGGMEQRQSIPTISSSYSSYSSGSSSHEKFFHDMKTLENKTTPMAHFVPFMSYWPTYDAMTREQQAWYFYWRSQVRDGQAPDTDLSYIFVYVYELLSGIGWKTPQKGQEQLLWLWTAYQERYPKLTHYLQDWMFDFALQHQLPFLYPDQIVLHFNAPSIQVDLLIDKHKHDVPLKLPFDLLDALCDYSLVASKFYQAGHQALMREAIPRVVALADAALVKTTQKGILATYGPTRTRKRDYHLYTGAVCPDAGKTASTVVKAYTDKSHLRTYVNELVRYGENALRSHNNCRGRLRGVTLDADTAALIDHFIDKEYGTQPQTPQKASADVTLDFSNIQTLRCQSDDVREALRVEEKKEDKPLLTDLKEISAIFTSISPQGRDLLGRLREKDWEAHPQQNDEQIINTVNSVSAKYLGCALLHIEDGLFIVEDDYRDELEEVFAHPPAIKPTTQNQFCLDKVSTDLQELLQQLNDEQVETLRILLTQDQPQIMLEALAEHSMTMPQMLLDNLNEAALNTVGEILVDVTDDVPHILDEYQTQLKQAVA